MIAHAETYRFSVEEYHKLGEVGILGENDRIELLNGELVLMAPIGKRHAQSVRRMINRLTKLFGDLCFIDAGNPVVLDGFSEPQPDVLFVRFEIDETGELPGPEDVYAVVEVADSSLRYDTTAKLAAYARAGIREYWIVNLADNVVEVHRDPVGDRYTVSFHAKPGEKLAPLAFPDREIDVEDILP